MNFASPLVYRRRPLQGGLYGGMLMRVGEQKPLPPDLPEDPDTTAWVAAVVTAGGTVSLTRKAWVNKAIIDLKAAPTNYWADIVMWTVFAAENAVSMAVDWKTLVKGTAIGAPTQLVDRHLSFDGVDDGWDHGWAPSASAVITVANCAMGVYALDAPPLGSVYAAGCINNSATGQAMRLNPHITIGATGQRIQGQMSNGTAAIFDILPLALDPFAGLYWVGRTASVLSLGRDGTLIANPAIGTLGTLLPTRNMLSGCFSNNGTPAGFRPCKLAATIVLKDQTTTRWAGITSILKSYLQNIPVTE